jgi:hypothetical protein
MTGQVEHIATNKLPINPRSPRRHSALHIQQSRTASVCLVLPVRSSWIRTTWCWLAMVVDLVRTIEDENRTAYARIRQDHYRL